MQLHRQQSNFSGIKIVLIIAAVILVGYVGYVLYTNYKASTKETVSTKVEDIQPAPAISEPKDLDEAATAIEQVEVESGNMDDLTEIEKESSEF